MNNKEKWINIIGYKDYYISNGGMVKSYKNNKSIILKLIDNGKGKGYYRVCLYNRGIGKIHTVHRLVAKAYIPNLEKNPEVNHIDGNPKNNSVNNLEWVTRTGNMRHASRLGLLRFDHNGEKNTNHKLSKKIVMSIKIFHKYYTPPKGYWSYLSKILNVKKAAISKIIHGRTWNNVEV
jgi:hypothetical protein